MTHLRGRVSQVKLRIPEIILDPATPIKRKSAEFADNSTVHGRIAIRNHGRDGIIPLHAGIFNGGTVNFKRKIAIADPKKSANRTGGLRLSRALRDCEIPFRSAC